MSKIFSFHDQPIRIVSIDNQPWFIGRDIALLLGYTKTDKDIRRICKYVKLFKGTKSVPLKNAPRGLLIIPESDVWRLIIRSTLPKAQEIEEWVMSDVLPTLRKTGEYKVKQKTAPKKKALPSTKQLALISSTTNEIDALVRKVDFYFHEIKNAGEEIANLLGDESREKDPALRMSWKEPKGAVALHSLCSISSLFSSINFNIRSLKEIIAFRRQSLQ